MILSNKYELKCTTGPRDIPCRIGSGSGTGPLDCESRDPVPDSETLPSVNNVVVNERNTNLTSAIAQVGIKDK